MYKKQVMAITLVSVLQNTEESELIAIASATRSHLGAIAASFLTDATGSCKALTKTGGTRRS